MTEAATEALLEQVNRVRVRAHRAARAHYLSSKSAGAQHTRLGIPAILLSTLVGSTIFGSLAGSPSTILVVVTGLASLVVGGLSALQTFFGFEERAQQHRVAGAEYAALKRRLDLLALSVRTGSAAIPTATLALENLVAELNELERQVLDPPDRFYDRARKEQEVDSEGI